MFAHAFLHNGSINPNWILLDIVSSIDVFINPRLLTDIQKLVRSMKIHCNTGVVHVTHI